MFYQSSLLKFKYFLVGLPKSRSYNRFVFVEDLDDVVSLHAIQYENGYLGDATNQDISVVGPQNGGFQQLYILQFLQQIIDFRVHLYVDDEDWRWLVLYGFYDMNLIRFSDLVSYESLFPAETRFHQLWIVNMRSIGTPTYFIDLFSVSLWIAFITTFTLIGVLSDVGLYILKRYTNNRVSYATWYSMITNQGGEENFQFVFSKILVLSIAILAIMFHGSFGAFLSSYLAIRQPDLPFTNLDELMSITDYSICVPAGTKAFDYISDQLILKSNTDLHLNDHHCPEHFNNFDNFIKQSKTHDYCPMDKTVFFLPAQFQASTENCPAHSIIPLRGKYLKQPGMLLVSPGFIYRDQFNRGLILIRTAGFYKKIQLILKKMETAVELEISRLECDDLTIDFHQTQIILLIPLLGIVVSIVTLLLELLIKKIF